MNTRWALSAVIVLSLLLGGAAAAQGDYEPVFEESECLFDLPGITCGVLIVPEDRSDPAGNQVELAVAIIQSRSASPAADPVIYLEGGPGGAALFGIEDLQRHPIVDSRDLIVFDQRGNGFSVPSLNCPELEDVEAEDAIELCRDRLIEEGVNLDAYNTAASAADVNDLRVALGLDQVNLWGISYGTKLALITMRDFPEGIRSVVIDSVYPPEIEDLTQQATAFTGAYEALFDRCAADAACSEAFPDLEAVFYDTVAAYNESPVYFENDDGEVELTGDELLTQLFQALYDTERLPYLPYALDLLSYGDEVDALVDGYDILTGYYIPDDSGEELPPSAVDESTFVQGYVAEFGDVSDSEGQAYSVDCSEEYQLTDVDAAYAAAEAAPEPIVSYLIGGIESALADCDIWGVQTADPVEAQRVTSDIPTLVVSGAMDPITPPAAGESAAAGLPNGQFVAFPSAGHGITATDNEAGFCAQSLVVAFLDDPLAPLDTSCVDETDVMEFYTGM
ncbi:MAG TPA: alpha/beta fold hydrolase [Candidatus Limnocylindrales bacterium]|nr:alpha/beta fold hydrolase [Candidatus Limnocylindrales bacterium]